VEAFLQAAVVRRCFKRAQQPFCGEPLSRDEIGHTIRETCFDGSMMRWKKKAGRGSPT
jgi:hypothetical protein